MQRAIRAEWLLRQADELGYRAASAGQPRNANLRRARHRADYDHLADFPKVDVLQFVDIARDSVTKVSQLAGSADLQRFVSLLALRPALK